MSDKVELRTRLRALRSAMPPDERAAAAIWIARHGLRAFGLRTASSDVVGAYWPIRGEADPRPLAQALAARGARLALPVVHGEAMTFRIWSRDAELVDAGFGALGPAADAVVAVPTLLLTPLLGFDARGQRLGQGKGYYDRWLHEQRARGARPFVCGIAFACQQVAAIPSEPHDERLDAVVTERGFVAW